MPKQTSPEMSALASRVMHGYQPTPKEIRSLAACVLSQDETPAEYGAGDDEFPKPVAVAQPNGVERTEEDLRYPHVTDDPLGR